MAEARSRSVAEFDGIASALELIPRCVLPVETSDWTVVKHDVSNTVFTNRVVDRTVRLHLKVVEIGRLENSPSGYQVACVSAGPDATTYKLESLLIFPATPCVDADRLWLGDEIFVGGLVKDSLFKVTAEGKDFDCRPKLRLERVAVDSFVDLKWPEEGGERVRTSSGREVGDSDGEKR